MSEFHCLLACLGYRLRLLSSYSVNMSAAFINLDSSHPVCPANVGAACLLDCWFLLWFGHPTVNWNVKSVTLPDGRRGCRGLFNAARSFNLLLLLCVVEGWLSGYISFVQNQSLSQWLHDHLQSSSVWLFIVKWVTVTAVCIYAMRKSLNQKSVSSSSTYSQNYQ